MKRNRNGKEELTRMELKYCEHCGGLWFRESGDAAVYCEECKGKVEELPAPKKKPGRLMLPVQQQSLVNEYGEERWDLDNSEWETDDLECAAAGGAA